MSWNEVFHFFDFPSNSSSFSFVLREAQLAIGESERATYYNLDVTSQAAADLTREEALRWDVLPLFS